MPEFGAKHIVLSKWPCITYEAIINGSKSFYVQSDKISVICNIMYCFGDRYLGLLAAVDTKVTVKIRRIISTLDIIILLS